MRRRTYLAAATAVAVAGCTGDEGSESDGETVTTDPAPSPLEEPGDDGTIDDFGDFEPWSVVAGTASIDDERASAGDQSVLLEADADDAGTRIVRELPDPLDCSAASPGLAVATEDAIAPTIQLFDDDGNAIDFRTTAQTGELRRWNFGVARMDDDADPSTITEIHVTYSAGDDSERRLRVDDLHLVPRPDRGLVCLQFAGGHESIASEALPMLEDYGYPATAFVTTDRIREEADHEGNRLTESQLADLADAGWTIGSHTANGRILTDLDPAERTEQILDAREWLEAVGLDDGARYFSYPTDRYDEPSLELVSEVHDLGFAGRFPVQGRVTDPARYPRVVDPTVEDAETLLERTADLGGITTLCYYRIEDEAVVRFVETMAILDDLVSADEIELLTPRELATDYVLTDG